MEVSRQLANPHMRPGQNRYCNQDDGRNFQEHQKRTHDNNPSLSSDAWRDAITSWRKQVEMKTHQSNSAELIVTRQFSVLASTRSLLRNR